MLWAYPETATDTEKYRIFMYGLTYQPYDVTIMIPRDGLMHNVCNQICKKLKTIRKVREKLDEIESNAKESKTTYQKR